MLFGADATAAKESGQLLIWLSRLRDLCSVSPVSRRLRSSATGRDFLFAVNADSGRSTRHGFSGWFSR